MEVEVGALGAGKSLPRHSVCLGQPRKASWVWQGRGCFEGVLVPQDGDMGAVKARNHALAFRGD